LGFGVFFNLVFQLRTWSDAWLGFFTGGLLLLFFALLGNLIFRKESMGMGDVKFGAVLGFFLGWKMILFVIFIGFLFAFMMTMLFSSIKKFDLNNYIPMAPFFSVSSLTLLYLGSKIIKWYWELFVTVN
jgi:prepilin signal peptidase PulO-like enzyme (type II secretory pathway)